MHIMRTLLKTAIKGAIDAGLEIMKIYQRDFQVETKADSSPLTEADQAANAIINVYLKKTDVPIVSEENKEVLYGIRKDWTRLWMVDPLDGTKEFIKKNGEFTVNIALIEEGHPVLGVIYVPYTKELYFAIVSEKKAYKNILKNKHYDVEQLLRSAREIEPTPDHNKTIRVMGSRSHMNKNTSRFIERLKSNYKKIELVSRGSSLKFCAIAEGKSDIYPRFAPTMEWDTAAGHAICKTVGLQVIDAKSRKPMTYNKPNLLNTHFLVLKKEMEEI